MFKWRNPLIFRLGRLSTAASVVLLALLIAIVVNASSHIEDINPDASDNSNANASSGGRVNGLGADANNNQIFYAASEYGGLFKTTDAGSTWTRLNGHVPAVTWDVAVDPGNSNRVVATSWFDGRVAAESMSGIEVSTNGGNTWTHPGTAQPNDPADEGTGNDNTPQPGYSCSQARRTESSAFGIGFRPDAPANIFVGTNCGVAISNDSGATWSFVDPTPGDAADDVWDVAVQSGGANGIVDICGDDGHLRSTDGGATWIQSGADPFSSGRCSIAASPDESYVLFVIAVDNNVYESDDAGATWTNLGNRNSQGRIPFVVTNQRSDDGDTDRFNLWYSDTQLFRADCTTPDPPAQGGANRCPTAASWTNYQSGAHWDAGDLEFDTAVSVDACPMIYSTDGGVHTNTVGGSGCHAPTWQRSNVGLHALWAWNMDGADQAGDTSEDLLFGTQDNGTFAATNGGASSPTWTNPNCCDTFDTLADSSWQLATTCCFSSGRFNRLELAGPGYSGNAEINTYPAGNIPGFTFASRLAQFDTNSVALITSVGLNITTNINASPIAWTGLGQPAGSNPCGVWAADDGGTPIFYIQSGQCTGARGDQVWFYSGTAPGGSWTRIDNNDGLNGGFGVFAADPNDSDRLYASNLDPVSGPQMVLSTDGGTTWDNDPELDDLMTGFGDFLYQNQRGPMTFRGGAGASFSGYVQPSLLAYDAEDGNFLVAGGVDSGIFYTPDGGQNWGRLNDPDNGAVHLPRPRRAYFDHEPAGTVNVYVATQGRGMWRITIVAPTADANGPYVTDEGTSIVLDGSASSDPGGGALTYEWDFDDDGIFDDATGVGPTFDLVGQDGVYPVALKVTNPEGAFDIDETTVTVNNVAPAVVLNSDAPKDEGSTVTVSGVATDPGWLDPLTGTIDWGDGTAVEPLGGVLENNPPDATLTFEKSHIYGDNGNFSAEVCVSDDDTTTCESIELQIDNVDPTSEIDESGTILINGMPTFLAHAGDPIDFSGRSTDPGSDDLYLSWDWDDGPPAPDVTTTYLVNPPNPDPFPSPSIQPRDVIDMQTHAFDQACFYEISFIAEDDDGGSSDDSANVIIVGNADYLRSAGYWTQQFRARKKVVFSLEELNCYLDIVNYMSLIFSEVTPASTVPEALDVLQVNGNGGSMEEIFDRQLLAVWLNFANGAVEYDELVDTDFDNVPDTPFYMAVATAEAVRLDPTATREALEMQKNIMEWINMMDE